MCVNDVLSFPAAFRSRVLSMWGSHVCFAVLALWQLYIDAIVPDSLFAYRCSGLVVSLVETFLVYPS